MEAVDGKKVLFAGSNIPGCINSTLGYFKYVDSEVTVLLNYCGVPMDTDFGDFEDYALNGQGLIEHIRTHPQEKIVIQRMLKLYEEALIQIERTIYENPFYQISPNSMISSYDGYVSDLDLESF